MSPYLIAGLAIVALAGPPIGYVFYESALSHDNWGYEGGHQWKGGGIHGAPGPIAGAGLPVLLFGGGIYWVVRRSRQNVK